MKKIISVILCIMIVFSLSVCGGNVSNAKTQEVYYAGDDYNKGYKDWAARNNADDGQWKCVDNGY